MTASAASVSVPVVNDSLNAMDMELDNSVVDSVGFSPTVDVKDKIEADIILAKEVAETESVKEESCLDKDSNDADMSSKMAACDSDTGDLLSPTMLVFDEGIDERIKALDEQLNRMNQGVKSMPSSASTITPPAHAPVSEITPAVNDYRLKYGRRRRDASSLSSMNMESRNEPSEVAKSLLTRSSIFDQDTKRLENLQTKYEPVGGLYASPSMISTPVHSSLHGSGDGIGVTGAVPLDKPVQATMPYSNLSGWGTVDRSEWLQWLDSNGARRTTDESQLPHYRRAARSTTVLRHSSEQLESRHSQLLRSTDFCRLRRWLE